MNRPAGVQLDLLSLLGAPAAADRHAGVDAASLPWVIVSCGGEKLDRPAPAGELYIGSYHAAARRAAAAMTCADRTLILSAEHGLVTLTRKLKPYDTRLSTVKTDPMLPRLMARQARDLGLSGAVVVLAGRVYANVVRAMSRELLDPARPDQAPIATQVLDPCAGTKGIGEQLHVFAELAAGRRTVTR